MENKKVRNATKVVHNDIEFKSKLECNFYKTIEEEGLDVAYEPMTFTLMSGFNPTISFWNRNKSKVFREDMRRVRTITYTPDFIVTHKGMEFIIEAKGKENDTYPLKRKMFRKYIETMENPPVAFYEVHSKKELLEVIKKIKSYETT